MKKNILLISYSQTGQLESVASSFISPLKDCSDIILHHKHITPKKPYPFPWDIVTFMDTFPESIYLDGCEINEVEDDGVEYDLIILAYQVWFLSPSIPITGFLKSDFAKKKLKKRPVITLIGCRNMWIMAQESMKKLLANLDANLIDNVVLIDRGNSLETFITTPRWMLTGKTDSIWGMSEAGIDPENIKDASRFGKALLLALREGREKSGESLLQGLKAVEVNPKLIRSEKIATKSFKIWGGLIRKIGKPGEKKRKPIVMLYLMFLLLMIVTVVPINMLIQSLLRKIDKDGVIKNKHKYELPSGSGSERMREFNT